MAKDEVEEKKHAPTESRVRQLRRDGQAAHSQNFPEAVSVLALVIYLALAFNWISGWLQTAFSFDVFPAGASFGEQAWQIARALGYVLLVVCGPFLALAFFATVAAAVIDMRGLPVSAKSITPNFERLNPVAGLKRMFEARAAIELAKGVLKTLVIGAALVGVGLFSLNALLWSPTCGTECAFGAAKFTIGAALLIGAVLLFVFGLADLPLSRFLFSHENRMTPTEYKRDRKEALGDPVVRGARRQVGRTMLEIGPISEGLVNIIMAGEGVAIGLRFVRGETPAPVTMVKKLGAEAQTLALQARGKGLVVIDDDELARTLGQRAPIGEQIPQALFDRVAMALVRAKAL